MSRIRRLVATAALAVATVLPGTLVAIPSAQAEITQPGFYSVSYSDVLYRYYDLGPSDRGVYAATYAEWRAAGFPRPIPTGRETSFVKYSWSPTVYAATAFAGAPLWDRLDRAAWERAGYPAPQAVGWIEGSRIVKWVTSGELFLDGEDGSIHKLTYEQWRAAGFRPAQTLVGQGFMKLTWAPDVFRMYDLGTNRAAGYRIDTAQWAVEDYPTPEPVAQLPGAYFCKAASSPAIYYSALARDITYAEWQAAGFPAPRPC